MKVGVTQVTRFSRCSNLGGEDEIPSFQCRQFSSCFSRLNVFELEPPALCEVETSHTQTMIHYWGNQQELLEGMPEDEVLEIKTWLVYPSNIPVTLKLDQTWESIQVAAMMVYCAYFVST